MSKGVRRVLFGLAGLLVLAAVVLYFLLPAIASVRERSSRMDCANNLKQLGFAMKMYAGDHDGAFPSKRVDVRRYVSDQTSLFICPKSGNKPGTIETVDDWSDYVYIAGLSESNAPYEVLMYCPAKNNVGRGGNILFVDGHVEWFPSEKTPYDCPTFDEVIGAIGERRSK